MVLKKALLVFSLLMGSVLFASEDTNITKSDIGDKILLLYVDDDACHYCRQLDIMLQEGKAGELVEEHFVVQRVMLNEDLYLPEGLPVPFGTPTIYFLDENEEALIEPMRGEKTEEDLILFLEEAIYEKNKQHSSSEGSSFWEKLIGE